VIVRPGFLPALVLTLGLAPSPRKESPPPVRTIEEVVRDVQTLGGTVVRVRGRFRGRDLFSEDFCEGAPADGWAIRDGRFVLWVTGRKPRGDGWSLDPRRLDDALRWLEVKGRVELRGECFVLKAEEVALVSGPDE
jgi:hypothetical protein